MSGLDARVWALWLLVSLGLALATRHPLYLIVLSLAVLLAGVRWARPDRWPLLRLFLLSGTLLALVAPLYNVLVARYGTTVLLRLPEAWPVIGGALTLEALLYGLTAGLTLLTLLVIFGVFNASVSHEDLLDLVPASLRDLGLVLAIGLALVPRAYQSLQETREAQRLRGHRLRRPGDLVPLVVPLLTVTLEQALQYSEALEVRGFTAGHPRAPRLFRLALLSGCISLLIGLFGQAFGLLSQAAGLSLLGAGLALALSGLWLAGDRQPRTRYRPRPWTGRDTAAVVGLGLLALAFLLVRLTHPDRLAYPFSGPLRWPEFWPPASLLYTGPALVALLGRAGPEPER